MSASAGSGPPPDTEPGHSNQRSGHTDDQAHHSTGTILHSPVISYRPEIDGLRALAVLLVIVHHLGVDFNILPSGFLGVDVFFVISGYVITASIQRHASASLPSFLTGFYRRRVQRLVPALVLCVAVTGLLSCLVIPNPEASLLTGAASLFGLSNLELYRQANDYFGTDAAFNTFTQTWSLGVEEQFYLVYPLLAWAIGLGQGWRHGSPRIFRGVLILVTTLSLGSYLLLSSRDPMASYLLTPNRLWEMAAGALIVPLRQPRTDPRHATQRLPTFLSAPLLPLAILLVLAWAPQRSMAISTPLAVAATALLITTSARPGPVQRGLRHPWIRHLGLISYSLYLWHWSVISLSRWTIGIHAWSIPLQLLAMLLLAEASYRCVEQPLRRAPWARKDSGTIARGLVLSGVFSGLLAWLAISSTGSRLYAGQRTLTLKEQLVKQVVAGTDINNERCNLQAAFQGDSTAIADLARRCIAAPKQGFPTIFVAGDSHASALLPLESDLLALGFGLNHLSMNGCFFPEAPYGSTQKNCDSFQRTWADWILTNGKPGDVILIANYHQSHLGAKGSGQTRDRLLGPNGKPLRRAAEKRKLYLEGLNRFARRAEARGMRVVLFGAGPRLLNRDSCLPEWFRPESLNQPCNNSLDKQIRAAADLNREFRESLPPSIALIDPLSLLCPRGCELGDMRELLFDSDHLSAASAHRLTPAIVNLLHSPQRPSSSTLPRQTAAERQAP